MPYPDLTGQSASPLFMLSSEHLFPLHISFLFRVRPYISQISSAVQTGETKCIKKDLCHTRTFPDSRLHFGLCFPLSICFPCKDKHERKARQGKKARTTPRQARKRAERPARKGKPEGEREACREGGAGGRGPQEKQGTEAEPPRGAGL